MCSEKKLITALEGQVKALEAWAFKMHLFCSAHSMYYNEDHAAALAALIEVNRAKAERVAEDV